jgi:hypothetical protein
MELSWPCAAAAGHRGSNRRDSPTSPGIPRSVIVPPEIGKALGGATHIPVLAHYGGETTRSTLPITKM